jgi:sugar (pentulose or hexulose) kinase
MKNACRDCNTSRSGSGDASRNRCRGVFFIGIDAGTTKIKASLYNQELVEIGAASRDVQVHNPGKGMSEIDMPDLWDSLCVILRELKAGRAEAWPNLRGVGISGQGDGLWPINSAGEPARRRAIIWNDTRSKDLNIESIDGLDELLRGECANAIYTGSMPALQKWLKLNERETYDSIAVSLHCKDWLNFKLTGRAVSDFSDITCSSGMNIKNLNYIPELYRLLDIEEALETMPQGVEPTDIIGTVSPVAAEATGLPEGLDVIAGSIDCCAVSAGTDFYGKGEGCTIIGTALINEVCIDKDGINPDDLRGYLLYHVVKGRYIKMMGTKSGTATVDYFKHLLCPDIDMKTLDAEIERIPIGSNGLLIHPYIYGERAPFKNPFSFGSVFGIRSDHTRYELMRAAYEGLAMTFLDSYQNLPKIDSLYLTGGASRSPAVCRMYCDIIGLPARRQTSGELGTLGIVKMLMVKLGFAGGFEELRSKTYIEYQPDMERHEQYQALYRKFAAYRDSVEPHWKSEKTYY